MGFWTKQQRKIIDDIFESDRLFWYTVGSVVQSGINFKDWKDNNEEIVQQLYGMWISALDDVKNQK